MSALGWLLHMSMAILPVVSNLRAISKQHSNVINKSMLAVKWTAKMSFWCQLAKAKQPLTVQEGMLPSLFPIQRRQRWWWMHSHVRNNYIPNKAIVVSQGERRQEDWLNMGSSISSQLTRVRVAATCTPTWENTESQSTTNNYRLGWAKSRLLNYMEAQSASCYSSLSKYWNPGCTQENTIHFYWRCLAKYMLLLPLLLVDRAGLRPPSPRLQEKLLLTTHFSCKIKHS